MVRLVRWCIVIVRGLEVGGEDVEFDQRADGWVT